MDHLDLDQVVIVPDTPDRLPTQNVSVASDLEKKNISLKSVPSGKGKLFIGKSKNRLESSDNISRRQIHPLRGFSRTSKSSHHGHSMAFDSEDLSTCRNGPLFQKKAADNGQNKNSEYPPIVQSKKSLFTSQSSAGRDSAVVDLTKCNGQSPVLDKAFPSKLPGVTQVEEYKKGSVLAGSCSSNSSTCYPLIVNDVSEGRHLNGTNKVHLSHNCVYQVDNHNDSQPNAWKYNLAILNSTTLPRALRHRKLIRDGRISPTSIGKGKQPVEKDDGGFIGLGLSDYDPVTNPSTGQTDARDVVSATRNSHSMKGKAVLNHPFSFDRSDVKSIHKSCRTSLKINEKTSDGDTRRNAVGKFAESDGWRTTHSQSRKLNTLVASQSQNISTNDGGCFLSGYSRSMVMRKENEDYCQLLDASARPARQTRSHLGPQFDDNNGCYMAKDTIVKRQKQGSSSSGLAECSRSAADCTDIMFLGSSGHTAQSRLTENQNSVGITNSVISIDEVSPEGRNVSSHVIGCNKDATIAQVDMDETLARELQEQFYSEDPAIAAGEIDSHIALSLQQDEEPHHPISMGRQPVSNPRGRSSRNGARAPSSNRMATLRSRFPGQPRATTSSRGRNSAMFIARERNTLFPSDMDVDMRMHILEALESFSNMGVGSSLLQMERDFNENDYEMLSALDENNHQHGGATTHQINGLPQSTVQSENLEEACAICLESPTVGDIIRHLPCLHKFHKDCIDPWLMRRKSCPICKSSIS